MIDRKQLIARRKQILCRDEKNQKIGAKILPFFQESRRIGYYSPVRQEADIFSVRDQTKPIALPVVLNETDMEFYTGEHLIPGAFQIPEPDPASSEKTEPDVIVVPMLAFCGAHRIGYGKGYYDRYLKNHPDALRIGIAFDEQEAEFEPNPWDEPLDMLITPTRLFRFDRKTGTIIELQQDPETEN